MSRVNANLAKAIDAHHQGDALEGVCKAFYKPRRARQREERPEDPVGLLCAVCDALTDAARVGAITHH